MIPNEEKESWHFLTVKKLSALLKEITSKHDDDFYCLNCRYFFRTENKLIYREKICKNKDFCGVVMPSQKNNIVQFNQNMKSNKMPNVVYADLESLIKKIYGCANNPENLQQQK